MNQEKLYNKSDMFNLIKKKISVVFNITINDVAKCRYKSNENI